MLLSGVITLGKEALQTQKQKVSRAVRDVLVDGRHSGSGVDIIPLSVAARCIDRTIFTEDTGVWPSKACSDGLTRITTVHACSCTSENTPLSYARLGRRKAESSPTPLVKKWHACCSVSSCLSRRLERAHTETTALSHWQIRFGRA